MMTYGWAILIIVIVAAILYSTGVFNPYSSITQTITGFEPFTVSEQSCGNGGLTLNLLNTAGLPVEILNASITSANGVQTGSTGYINSSMDMEGEQTLTFSNSTCDSFGAFYSAEITIWYLYNNGIGLVTTSTMGAITGKAALQQTVIFNEVGLPAGTQWSVRYANSVKLSTSSQIAFLFSGSSVFVPSNASVNKVQYFPSVFEGVASNSSMYYVDYIPVRDVFVADGGSGLVSVINPLTNALVSNISVSKNPLGLSVTPDGKLVYVTNHGSSNISVINTSDNTVVANISVGTNPTGIATNFKGNIVYSLSEGGGGLISKINASTYQVINSSKVGGSPQAIAITPDDRYMYVTQANTNTVLLVDASTLASIKSIPVGSNPDAVAVSPDGRFAYVANNASASVSVISTASDTVIKTISVGSEPQAIAVSPNDKIAFVTNYGSNSVSVINISSLSVINTIPVGTNPTGIVILPNSTKMYVAAFTADLVSVIYTGNYSLEKDITSLKNPTGIADAASNSI